MPEPGLAPGHGAHRASPRPPSAHCYGHTDWPADAALTQQAATHLAAALAQHPAGATVRCSTLQRCQQLANALTALKPDVAVIFDDRLTEMHFGQWEGLAWDEVDRHGLDAWAADFAHHRVGHSGESVLGFVQRVAQAARHAHGPTRTDDLWITHAGVIRAMHWLHQRQWRVEVGQLQATHWPVHAPAYGEWSVLDPVG